MTPKESALLQAIGAGEQVQCSDAGHWYDIAPHAALSEIGNGHAKRLRIKPIEATPEEVLKRLRKEYRDGTAAQDWPMWAGEMIDLIDAAAKL